MTDNNAARKNVRVLLLEDSDMDAELIGKKLDDFVNRVDIDRARNGKEFTDILERGGCDIVVSDYSLPGFDAPAALLIARSMYPDIPFICVSGLIGEEKAVELLKMGATDFVTKSNLDKLLLVLQRAMDEVGERDKLRDAENKIRENEAFLEGIIENIPDMIFVKDAQDLKFIRFNKAGEKLLGYSKYELYGKNDYDLFPKEVADNFTFQDRTVLKSDQIVDIPEETIQTRYKGKRFLHTKKISFKDEKGNPLYLLGISEDITERKRADDKLRESAQDWQDTFDSAKDMMTLIAPDHRFIKANKAACRSLGKTQEEIVGKKCFELVHGTDSPIAACPCVDVINTGREAETEIEDHGRFYLVSASPVYDDGHQIKSFVHIVKDITERKQDEEMIRLSEERYRELFENIGSGVAVYEVSDEGNEFIFKHFNKAAERIDGERREDIIGKSIHDVYPGIDDFGILPVFRRVWKTGVSEFYLDKLYTDKRFSKYYDNFVYRLSTGEIVAVFNDVTDRRHAEEALKVSEEKYRNIVQYSPIGISHYTFDGKFIDVNLSYAKMLGYDSPEEVLDTITDIAEQIYVESSSPNETFTNKHSSNEFINEVNYYRRRNGEIWCGSLRLRIIKDHRGKPDHFECFTEDITDRKKTEEALKVSEEKYRNLFENSRDALMIIEPPEPRFTSVNQAAANLFGAKSLDEILTLAPADLSPEYQPDGRASSEKAPIMNEIVMRNGYHLFEWTHKRVNGEVFPVSVLLTRVEFGNKQLIQATVRDITEQKKAEKALANSQDALMELNRKLEQRVQEEVRNNREKDIAIIRQSRLASLGEMIHNIAHQWRQPLNNLGLMVQGLKDHYMDRVFPQKDMLKFESDAMDLVLYMSRTIDDFRKFYLPEKEEVTFHIAEVVRRAVSIVDAAYKNNFIELSLEMDESLSIAGYPNEFAQVLLNIMNNSKEAFAGKKTAKPRVTVRVAKEKGKISVSVKDNAGGVPANEVDKIFTPYYSTKEMGTGIGLYMSKMIIEKNMNGRISVQNLLDGLEVKIVF